MQATVILKQDPKDYIWANRDENREWRRLRNEKVHNLYRSPKIVRVVKSRSLRWEEHMIRMEVGRSCFKIEKRIKPRRQISRKALTDGKTMF